jgi:hypothetical protein
VRRTPKRGLPHGDFSFDDQKLRGLEQNPAGPNSAAPENAPCNFLPAGATWP